MEQIIDPGILTSTMKRLGVDHTDTSETSFAEDVLQSINSALLALTQIGIGPNTGFRVVDESTLWSDFIGDGLLFDNVKDYVYLRCRLVFDPPTAAITESFKQLADEALWRCKISAEQLSSS